MSRHNLSYFIREGVGNLFSHGFMSFAAIGVTVACLVIMGTFSLVAYNAEVQLEKLESDFEILAFIEEDYTLAQEETVSRAILALPNVKDCLLIDKEEAMNRYLERNLLDEYVRQNVDPTIFRDRFAVFVNDLNHVSETAERVRSVTGVAEVRVEDDVAGGFIMLRNVAGVVCIALIAILLIVSVFIISNTIRLTTFDRRDEIAIMKMVGASDSFIRWPFVYEGFVLGLLSAVLAFGLQWLLYETVVKAIAASDTLRLLDIVPFVQIWQPVALIFLGAGVAVGVGGSLTAIRKFLQV